MSDEKRLEEINDAVQNVLQDEKEKVELRDFRFREDLRDHLTNPHLETRIKAAFALIQEHLSIAGYNRTSSELMKFEWWMHDEFKKINEAKVAVQQGSTE